ncbi:MAG TPA: DUF4911 domain-containing protein [Verrucomicrobiae bacterium]|nr:DUF4911 domain-containing protein [Verrucomicrobiae bacterium]
MHGFSSTVRFFQVPRSQVCYLKFILEAYDGLATLTTVDPAPAVVSVTVPDALLAEAEPLLQSLAAELGMKELPAPTSHPPEAADA